MTGQGLIGRVSRGRIVRAFSIDFLVGTLKMANASTSSGQPLTLTLLQAVRGAIRRKHYSYRSEKCYLFWVRQFLR